MIALSLTLPAAVPAAETRRLYPHSGTATVDTTAEYIPPVIRPSVGLRELAGLGTLDQPDSSDATGTLPAYPVIVPSMNSRVQAFVTAFTTRDHKTVENWLERGTKHFPLVAQIFQREHLPLELACVVFIESGFNLHARSWANAVGPWQFIASTARLLGLTITREVDERRDMEKSTIAAARYFQRLYAIFGSWELVLAAYNSGDGTVRRAIKRQGTTDYWKLNLPRDTRNYVPQFYAILHILKEPERYGFTIPGARPLLSHPIVVDRRTSLAKVAKRLDVPLATIQELNPAYRAGYAPAGSTLRVPLATSAEDLAELAGRPTAAVMEPEQSVTAASLYGPPLPVPDLLPVTTEAPVAEPPVVYVDHPRREEGPSTTTVLKRESVSIVARRVGVAPRDLRRWNNLTANAHLVPGQVLRITPPPATDGSPARPSGGGTRRPPQRAAPRVRDRWAPLAAAQS